MKRTYWLFALVPSISACDPTRPAAPDPAVLPNAVPSVAPRTWAQEVVIDFIGPRYVHAGPGPHPTTESDRYTFLFGPIHWFAGGTIEYRISGTEPVTGANAAIVAGEQAWDALIPTRVFARSDGTSQTNPCTDLPNTVSWAAIDGPGDVLGFAAPCYDLISKEIVGFSITFDSDELWGTNGDPALLDVGNAATHEFGHAVGLGHVGAPRDGCLTMYKFAAEGEIQKRTLGLGDKLGLTALYGNTQTSAGACGA